MRIIGLTGGIASGKSTVARMLEKRGAAVIDADQLAREVVMPGEPALQAIAETPFKSRVFMLIGAYRQSAHSRASSPRRRERGAFRP